MYVLKGSDDTLYPADRCTFKTTWSAAKNAYEVSDATFYNGASTTGTPLTGDVELGVIGKTGRFVALTD